MLYLTDLADTVTAAKLVQAFDGVEYMQIVEFASPRCAFVGFKEKNQGVVQVRGGSGCGPRPYYCMGPHPVDVKDNCKKDMGHRLHGTAGPYMSGVGGVFEE